MGDDILEEIVAAGIIGAVVCSFVGLFCGFGTRKIQDAYTFSYLGKPAVVKQKDIRWGPDEYYFLLNGKDKVTGTLTTDDGREIEIYKTLRSKNHKYSIRDAPTNPQSGSILL